MRGVRVPAAVIAVALTCASCVTAVGAAPVASVTATTASAYQQLTVVGFTRLGARLAVEVRNDGVRTVDAARAVIVSRDRLGTVVGATSGPVGTPCCLLTDLPRGATAAVYADLGVVATGRVTSVAVTAVPLPRGTLPAIAPPAVGDVALQTSGTGAVVRVQLTAVAAVVVLRAELVDTRGRIVTVAGARVPCRTGTADLTVPDALPPSTVVRSVSAQAVASC